jgi:hypothetical protein
LKEKWKEGFGLVLDHEGHFNLKLARFSKDFHRSEDGGVPCGRLRCPIWVYPGSHSMMKESQNLISMTMLAKEQAFSFGNEVS